MKLRVAGSESMHDDSGETGVRWTASAEITSVWSNHSEQCQE